MDHFEYGTRQATCPTVDGVRLLEQSGGVIMCFIDRSSVLQERNERQRQAAQGGVAGALSILDFEGAHQLSIEQDDMLFVARTDAPGSDVVVTDQNAFASFNGLKKYCTAAEYRMIFRFLGIALVPLAYDKIGVGEGTTAQCRGIANFINRSGDTLMPGEPLTWEPLFPDLQGVCGDPSTKRARYGDASSHCGPGSVRGIFVKWVPPAQAYPWQIWPSLYTNVGPDGRIKNGGEANRIAGVSDEDIRTLMWRRDIGAGDIVAWNSECTYNNQWGRIVLP